MQKATFAAGCFWGVEATFRQMPGVISTASATRWEYRESNLQGRLHRPHRHAEAVEVEFDPAKVRYEDLLKVFWKTTTPLSSTARAGLGTQYRSAIFFHTSEQQTAAQASKESLEKARATPSRS